MRKTGRLIVAAMTGAVLVPLGGISPVAARVTLNQCILSFENCRQTCEHDAPLPPPFRWSFCFSMCRSSHQACADKAMGSSTGDGGPSKRRPSRPPAATLPPPSILEVPPAFPRQPPAPTGTPLRGGR